jgi:hypothetical protein
MEVQLPQQSRHRMVFIGRKIHMSQPLGPVRPNRSDTGGRGIMLRCRIARTWFLIFVRCRTRCARRTTCRPNIRVRSSGNHTGGRKSAAVSTTAICAKSRCTSNPITRPSPNFWIDGVLSRISSGVAVRRRCGCHGSTAAAACDCRIRVAPR